MKADKITYFAVDNGGCIRQNSEWNENETDSVNVFNFFSKVPSEILDDLGIELIEKPYFKTRLKRPVEEANSIAENRGLYYRFSMEFWISEDEDVSKFIKAIKIDHYKIMEEVLRTNHGMDDKTIRNVTEDRYFDSEFHDEFHIRMREYISDYRQGEHEVDEMSGTWGYYRIIIGSNLSKVQKETKDLIMSITEEVLAKAKTRKGKKKR